MNTKEISPVVVIPVAIVVVVLLIYFGFRAMSPPSAAGGYTPGVPPWKDPLQKASYTSGKTQAWRSANDWKPQGQSAPAATPSGGPPGAVR